MKQFIAVRARSATQAIHRLSEKGVSIIKSSVERREPALRNMVEGFHQNGLSYDIDGNGVYWLLAEHDRSKDYFERCSAVECVFDETWFTEQTKKVRYLKGVAYCDATRALAKKFQVKDQNRTLDWTFEPVPALSDKSVSKSEAEQKKAGKATREVITDKASKEGEQSRCALLNKQAVNQEPLDSVDLFGAPVSATRRTKKRRTTGSTVVKYSLSSTSKSAKSKRAKKNTRTSSGEIQLDLFSSPR